MTTAAKALRRAAEGKAFAQAEAAAWKERIVLQCPNLETIHAAKCVKTLHEVLDTQVNDCAADNNILSKRMADGSKRVRVPYTPFQLPSDDSKQFEPRKRRCIVSTR